MNKIKCVIFDWAGTTVDYGCMAPVAAFISAFSDLGVAITESEARGPMGMTKIDHIRELFKLEGVTDQFDRLFGRAWTEQDVEEMNKNFEKYLFASLANYTTPIDGVLDCVAILQQSGLRIGSTTGYTAKMMDIVAPNAQQKGYKPECYVTSDGLPAGRPQPFMIYQNMINLAIASAKSVVKVGDTVSDIQEGVNAGVWSVGIVLGSSEMGLSKEQVDAMCPDELAQRMDGVRQKFKNAGAHFTIDTIGELPQLIEKINNLN